MTRWVATVEFNDATSHVGEWDDEDEALRELEDAAERVEFPRFCDEIDPWEQEADGTWHATLTDGSELVVRKVAK